MSGCSASGVTSGRVVVTMSSIMGGSCSDTIMHVGGTLTHLGDANRIRGCTRCLGVLKLMCRLRGSRSGTFRYCLRDLTATRVVHSESLGTVICDGVNSDCDGVKESGRTRECFGSTESRCSDSSRGSRRYRGD